MKVTRSPKVLFSRPHRQVAPGNLVQDWLLLVAASSLLVLMLLWRGADVLDHRGGRASRSGCLLVLMVVLAITERGGGWLVPLLLVLPPRWRFPLWLLMGAWEG